MGKKDIDWEHIGFNYIQTDKRYVSNLQKTEPGTKVV